MSTLQNMHYKDISPIETIFNIRNALAGLGILMIEKWYNDENSICKSLRLNIENTDIGTNGKGVNSLYALASAYAEFCERLQNNMLSVGDIHLKEPSAVDFVDEKFFNSYEIAAQDNSFYNQIFKKLNLHTLVAENRAKAIEKSFICTELHGNPKGKYACRPFFSVKNDKSIYLMNDMYILFYGSNGMCAGNSREEALVQGISEIFERYVQKKVLCEKLSLPNIPEEYIMQFPHVYNMYTQLKSQKSNKYEYIFKDCSLGGKYPVAALIAIEKNTGYFGIKFGCHPDYGIAMERAITEAFQGRRTQDFLHVSKLDFGNTNVDNDTNIYNSFKVSVAQYPVELFMGSSKYEFTPVEDVKHLSNSSILRRLLKDIIGDGYDILIRDVSYIGLPSYHVIIPGMSELLEISDTLVKAYNTAAYVSKVLKQICMASDMDLDIVVRNIDYHASSHLENMLKNQYALPISHKFPGDEYGMGPLYLSSMCRYKQLDFHDALLRITRFNQFHTSLNLKIDPFYEAVQHYIAGKVHNYNNYQIIETLSRMYTSDIIHKLEYIFENQDTVLARQYPILPCPNCTICSINKSCAWKTVEKIKTTLYEKQLNSFPDQDNLREITQL